MRMVVPSGKEKAPPAKAGGAVARLAQNGRRYLRETVDAIRTAANR